MTSYVVVTGTNTAFPGCKSRRLEEITDRKEETVLLVEVANSDIHWMEPRDLTLEELSCRINDSSGKGPCSRHVGGATVDLDGRRLEPRYVGRASPERLGGPCVNVPRSATVVWSLRLSRAREGAG